MAPSTLLGPPELYETTTAPAPAPALAPTPAVSGDPFVDLMVANYNTTATHKKPPMGKTENYSPTFMSTGNPCLDFFFHVVPDTPPQTLNNLLHHAWNQDPLKALKLVCNLRGIRGTGKSDREGFYTAALWLHNNHPKTLASNVASFAEFGYFKDLPEILFRLLEGAAVRRKSVKAAAMPQRMRDDVSSGYESMSSDSDSDDNYHCRSSRSGKWTREEKRIEKAKRAVQRFNRDPDFKLLHECVSDVFAQRLRSDLKLLNSSLDSFGISQAAKWCPSPDSCYDRITLLCETIAKKVFPREEYPEYEGVEEAHYAYRVRDRLRKEVLVPLRRALQLPEAYIGDDDWGSIRYEKVEADDMIMYQEEFLKNDKERFEEYLGKVKSGEAEIGATTLLPHEIIEAGGEVAELQWKRMVEELANKGEFTNCLAICDVSRSMRGAPMEVTLALGVLVSELSQGPWKGKLISFNKNPTLQMVEGDTLRAKMEDVRRMEVGKSNAGDYKHKDLERVFDVLIKVAVRGKLRGDEMIKRVFVLSDMEFEESCEYRNQWETDYEAIVRKFRENGYGESVPEMVFWNLRNSRATPVPANQSGAALVSGFSNNLMALFLENKGTALDPEAVMEVAISGPEYQKLLVVHS